MVAMNKVIEKSTHASASLNEKDLKDPSAGYTASFTLCLYYKALLFMFARV